MGSLSHEKWVQKLEGEQQCLPLSFYLAYSPLAGLLGPTQYSNSQALASVSTRVSVFLPSLPIFHHSLSPALQVPGSHPTAEVITGPSLDRQPCLLKIPSVTSLPQPPMHPHSPVSHS